MYFENVERWILRQLHSGKFGRVKATPKSELNSSKTANSTDLVYACIVSIFNDQSMKTRVIGRVLFLQRPCVIDKKKRITSHMSMSPKG